MKVVIEIPTGIYKLAQKVAKKQKIVNAITKAIANGTPLKDVCSKCWLNTKEGDKEYKVEVITRGNCIMCGKELTEGLFFCKECKEKANSRK